MFFVYILPYKDVLQDAGVNGKLHRIPINLIGRFMHAYNLSFNAIFKLLMNILYIRFGLVKTVYTYERLKKCCL